MLSVEVLQEKLLPSPIASCLWALAAVLMGCVFALTGMAGIVGLLAAAVLILFSGIAIRFPSSMLGIVIGCVALVPFNAGVKAGSFVELYGDEALPLLYLAAIPILYIFGKRLWCKGFGTIYAVALILILLQALSFVYVRDSIAYRNFLDAYVLGALLLVLFLQESSNGKRETVGNFIIAVTVLVAALSILERIMLRNPILENDPSYISPQLAQLTFGVYRPYVTFFHPSEAGTFMAIGVPFAVRYFIRRRSFPSLFALIILLAGLIINATRGVWVGIIIAALLELRYIWALLFATLPVAALGGYIAYITFQATPFVQRLTDPNDLLVRFESWKLIGRIVADHPWIGAGHMQYTKIYLNYVQNVSEVAHFNAFNVGVADNVFLTTAAEHGMLGLFGLVLFLFTAYSQLRRFRIKLFRWGLAAEASFVRCAELALVIYVVCGLLADVQLFTKASRLIFIIVGLGLAEGARAVASSGIVSQEKRSEDVGLPMQTVWGK